MKNVAKIFILLIAALMLFTSCDQEVVKTPPKEIEEEVSHKDIVEVGLAIAQEKVLSSDINRDIKYWEFMATPQFKLSGNEKVYGTVSYWRSLSALDTTPEGKVQTETNLGRYTSGEWLFEVRALNSNKRVVAVGSTKQVVREGLDNTVVITALIDRTDRTHGASDDDDSRFTGWDGHDDTTKQETVIAKGSLHVGFVTNRLDENITKMKIVTKYQKVNKTPGLSTVTEPNVDWEVRTGSAYGITAQKYTKWYEKADKLNYGFTGDGEKDIELGRLYYEALLENLEPGPYIFTFYVQGLDKNGNWINLGGQALDVVIVGGEETIIKGTVLANEYVLAGLRITAPGTIYGSINGANFLYGDPNQKIKLEWKQDPKQEADSGEKPTTFFWFVNGKAESTTKEQEYTFQCPRDEKGEPIYGIYRVSCSPTGDLGSTGTSTIDIIFNPTDGPNVGEFDWSQVAGRPGP